MSINDDQPSSPSSGLARLLQRLSPSFARDDSGPGGVGGATTSNAGGAYPGARQPPVGVIVSTVDEVHAREETLNNIDDAYFDADFDAIDKELGAFAFSKNPSAELNAVAEERSMSLECISDTLSMNILRDYDRFNEALTCVTDVRDAVNAAKTSTKTSRDHLARCSQAISQGVKVWKNAQKKKNIAKTLGILQQIQAALRRLGQVEEALESAEYGEAVEQCLAVGEIVASDLTAHGIYAADTLSAEANRLLCETAERMYASLSSMTVGQFDEETYASLMEGYTHLTDPEKIVGGAELSPSQDILSAFTAAPRSAVKRVIAGICARDAGSWECGQEIEPSLVELLGKVPVESFKACMQMVLKVSFDILVSFRMVENWHRDVRLDADANGAKIYHSIHGVQMLESVRTSLPRAKGLVWNEVSAALMAVLQSIKPGHGEAFVVVSTWVREFLEVGKDFSGEEPEGLEAILSHQSVRFFKGHHINCVEALFTIMERETFAEVDVGLPWFAKGIEAEESSREAGGVGQRGDGKAGPNGFAEGEVRLGLDLDDCVRRMVNPWDDLETDGSLGPRAPGHYDIKAVFRQHGVVLGDGRELSTTNSFWRLVKWIMEYVSLIHDLPSAAPAIFGGLVELVDLFMLHIHALFTGAWHGNPDPWCASACLDEFLSTSMGTGVGGIGKYTAALEAWFPSSPLVPMLRVAATAPSSSPAAKTTPDRGVHPRNNPKKGFKNTGNSSISTPRGSVCNSGNLYGLVERAASSSSLQELARFLEQLRRMVKFEQIDAQADIQLRRAIAAIPDMHLALYGTCCSLLLPTAWIPEAVAQGSYLDTDPPLSAAPWTSRLGRQLDLLAAQLDTSTVSVKEKRLLWSFVFPAVSHAIVGGLARVRKCTLEGRSAMSLDLQAVAKLLLNISPTFGEDGDEAGEGNEADDAPKAANKAIRFIDDYIKAFYIPIADLHAWSKSHPGYSHEHVLAVANCAADSLGGPPTVKEDLAELRALLDCPHN